MSTAARRIAIGTLAAVALGMVLLQVGVLPLVTARSVREAPDQDWLVAPLWAAAVAASGFVQLALLVLARVIRRLRDDASLPTTERPWLIVLAALSALATVSVLAAHVLLLTSGLGGPPALMLAMLLCIALGCGGTIAAIVARHRITAPRAAARPTEAPAR